MFVYVATGPFDIEARRFLSRTIVDRFSAACEMLDCVNAPFIGMGVAAPVLGAGLGGLGVEKPLLSCVAMTDASLRAASATICLMFLLRRCEGFHLGLRNALGLSVRSSRSNSCWCESSAAGVDGAMIVRCEMPVSVYPTSWTLMKRYRAKPLYITKALNYSDLQSPSRRVQFHFQVSAASKSSLRRLCKAEYCHIER